ncbi:MAG: complex I NDUFA9 subunit family protein [Sneathiellaceae bacterium]
MTGKTAPIVTVFGGTGFVGRHVVRALLQRGSHVRVASRHPERQGSPADDPGPDAAGTPVSVRADVRDAASVRAALDGASAAVNAVSLYVERGAATFEAIHVEAAACVAREAQRAGVRRLVHISGIGADADAPDPFIRARGRGEAAVRRAAGDCLTLARPSVMVGPGDALITAIADLARRLPVYPLFGRGETRLQPAFVKDVARAIAASALEERKPGPLYAFAGPEVLTYRALVERVARHAGARTRPFPVPFAVWEILARAAGMLPHPPLTRGQVALMRRDNVAGPDVPGLRALDVRPTPVDEVIALTVGGIAPE